MGIAFGSINSGLPKDIVKQIVEAERIPIRKMEERKGKVESKQKLLGELIKLVESMRGELLKNKSERSLRELQVLGGADNVDIKVDKNVADPGKYNLEVLELAQKSSAITNGVEDKDKTYIGVGYLSCNLPNGETKEIYIDEEHATLSGIAKLINGDPDLGMRANVINDGKDSDEPWRLLLALDDTGDNMKAEFPYLYLVDGEVDLYLDEEREAKDAKIKLDGFEIEVPANQVADLIPGVTIDLKKAKPGDEFTFEIIEDTAKITEKMNTLIESINNTLKFIKDQNNLNEKSDTSRTLGGDLTLQTIESRVRRLIFTSFKTVAGPMRMSDIGVSFQRNGLLKLDQAKLDSALTKNYKAVSNTLVGQYTSEGKTDGFIDSLEKVTQLLLTPPSGPLPSRKAGLRTNIDQIDRQIATRNRMIERKEEILKQKFARLEETIARIKGQGAGLAGLTQAPNPVAQLG